MRNTNNRFMVQVIVVGSVLFLVWALWWHRTRFPGYEPEQLVEMLQGDNELVCSLALTYLRKQPRVPVDDVVEAVKQVYRNSELEQVNKLSAAIALLQWGQRGYAIDLYAQAYEMSTETDAERLTKIGLLWALESHGLSLNMIDTNATPVAPADRQAQLQNLLETFPTEISR